MQLQSNMKYKKHNYDRLLSVPLIFEDEADKALMISSIQTLSSIQFHEHNLNCVCFCVPEMFAVCQICLLFAKCLSSFEKSTILKKSTPGINFTNILGATFWNVSVLQRFSVRVVFIAENNWPKSCP